MFYETSHFICASFCLQQILGKLASLDSGDQPAPGTP